MQLLQTLQNRLLNKPRRLGVANEKRRYDLPLNNDSSLKFLIILIAIMTFLASMALAGYLTLGKTARGWSNGLENKLTIEIPAETAQGKFLTKPDIQTIAQNVQDMLVQSRFVESAEVMSDGEVQQLIEPWLGNNVLLTDIPLPGLISVTLADTSPGTLNQIQVKLREISPHIQMDTHETWLGDLIRLAGTMQIATALITLVIMAAAIMAITGAIRARMAVHHDDLELLHLMGASDNYIAKQFQRHAFIITLQGALIGIIAAMVALLLISLSLSGSENTILPGFTVTIGHITGLILLAIALCGIATATAHHTTLRALGEMP